jgi:hypothetical protein
MIAEPQIGDVWRHTNALGYHADWELVSVEESDRFSTEGIPLFQCQAILIAKDWPDDEHNPIGCQRTVVISASRIWEKVFYNICGECSGRAALDDYLCDECRKANDLADSLVSDNG